MEWVLVNPAWCGRWKKARGSPSRIHRNLLNQSNTAVPKRQGYGEMNLNLRAVPSTLGIRDAE